MHLKSRGELKKKMGEWLDANKNEPCCNCGSKENPTPDHIIPQAILKMLGIDCRYWWDPDLLQILCRRCNLYKGDRLDFSNPKTKQLLIIYLNKYV